MTHSVIITTVYPPIICAENINIIQAQHCLGYIREMFPHLRAQFCVEIVAAGSHPDATQPTGAIKDSLQAYHTTGNGYPVIETTSLGGAG